jgi:inosose dehydratase
MNRSLNRRSFLTAAAAAIPASKLAAARRLKVGHTCITWGTFPNPSTFPTLETAVKDIAAEGYHGFETFPEVLEDYDAKGTLQKLIDTHKLPLTSGYIRLSLVKPEDRKETVAQAVRLAKVLKKYKANFAVLAPGGFNRQGYDFKAHKDHIVSVLNDAAKAVNDVGLAAGLHQHTGTCIETREETYAVMESADTRHLKFAPDVGQLQKGGSDALKVVKDFVSLVRHMHLKDWNGGPHWLGYCPLGQGKVDLAGILDAVEGSKQPVNIMVELDESKDPPMTPLQTAQTAKAYLKKQGYTFRT